MCGVLPRITLTKTQESVEIFCVKEQMTDGDGKHFKMRVQLH